jgi:hypothetical protein
MVWSISSKLIGELETKSVIKMKFRNGTFPPEFYAVT